MLIGIACGNPLASTSLSHVASSTHFPVSGNAAALCTGNPRKRMPGNYDSCGRNSKLQVVKATTRTKNDAACLSYISTISFNEKSVAITSAVDQLAVLSSIANSRPTSRVADIEPKQLAGNPTSTSTASPNFDLTFAAHVEEDVLWQSGEGFSYVPDLKTTNPVLQLLYFPGLRYAIVVPGDTDGAESTSCQQQVTVEAEDLKRSDEEQLTRSKRLGSLVLLNILAAIYGTGTVVNRCIAAPGDGSLMITPASLSSLVRYGAALGVFFPALTNAFGKRDLPLLKAGTELGAYLFADTFFASLYHTSKNAAWDSSSLLFAVSVIFVPLMEIRAGKSVSKITWLATFAALSGMGLLEEDGSGWKGISMPQMPQLGDLWSVAGSLTSALHILRSEALGSRFDAFLLTAVQMLVLTVLSLLWEAATLCNGGEAHLVQDIGNIPWGPLLYGGLVCTGLCSWLELRGLRWVHASTATLIYTTIPMWGALFAFLLSNETAVESAAVAAQLVLVGGFVARWLARHHDTLLRAPRRNASADHLPGAFLSSQLKFPYYATQAQKLVTEAKLNVGAVKGMLMSFGVATGGKTTDLASGSPGIASSAHVEHLAHAAVSVLHGVQVGDMAASLMVGMASGLDSAAVAVGSDLVQALEEAEDAVSLLLDVLNTAGGSVSHASVDSVNAVAHFFTEAATRSDFLHTLLTLLGSNAAV